MRILRVANVPNNKTGGMSRAMYGSGDALVARGHHVDYLWAEDLPQAGPRLLRHFSLPLALPRLLRDLAKQGRRYDVIEIHEPLAAPSCFFSRRGKLPPIVIFSHGLEERGRVAMMNYNRSRGLKTPLKARISSAITVWQAKYAVRKAAHVLCCNGADLRHLQRVGVPKNRLTQHINGMEDVFLKAGSNLQELDDSSRQGVLFVGSWITRKGILELVPAMNEVLRRHPDLRFTIVGCGPLEEQVRQSFAEDVRAQIVTVAHASANEDLIELYRKNSVFVLPSVAEGFPLVMMEAAAMGLALVMTDVCGMADFIEDEVSGLTMPVGDAKTLTQNVERLVNDDDLTRRLGEAARAKAPLYTWAISAENLEKAYQSALDDS